MSTLEVIFKLFEKSGRSDYALVKEIGLKRTSISNWRQNLANPSADALRKIADYFDVSVDYLMGRTENPKINN